MNPSFVWNRADLAGKGRFYSDLHLGRSPLADNWILEELDGLLQTTSLPDFIVWGGDTFDFLVGHNRFSLARVSPFLARLRALQELGVRQWLLEGNHDFHLGWLAHEIPGLRVVGDGIEDPTLHIRITHGDALAPGWLYPRLRRFFRLESSLALLELLPDGWTDRAARRWSKTSYDLRGSVPNSEYLDRVAAGFVSCMQADTGWTWICGHIHYPALLERSGMGSWWINGYWHLHRCHLRLLGGKVEGIYRNTTRLTGAEVACL